MRRKSIEEYIEECQPIAEAKGITILGTYGEDKGAHTKMINRCEHGHEWNTTTFHSFKDGRGCPKCAYREGSKK